MHRILLASLGAAASLLAVSSASAAVVTIDFAGNLTTAYYGGQTGKISGTATYDTGSADTTGEYQVGAITAFTLTSPILTSLLGQATVTESTYTGSTGDVHYVPDSAGAGYGQFELTFHLAHAPSPQLNFNLVFPSGLLPGGYGLPTSLPSYTQASYAGVRLDDTYGDITLGQITKFDMSVAEQPSAAPEPASWALMIVGFGGAGAAIRRRRTAVAA